MAGLWYDLAEPQTEKTGKAKRSPLKREVYLRHSSPVSSDGSFLSTSSVRRQLENGGVPPPVEGLPQHAVLKSQVAFLLEENKRLQSSLEMHHSTSTLSPINHSSRSITSVSTHEGSHVVEVQSLRDALDHVTREKKGFEVLCHQLKEQLDHHRKNGFHDNSNHSDELSKTQQLLEDSETRCSELESLVARLQESREDETTERQKLKLLSTEIKLLKVKMEQSIKERTNELNESLDECERIQGEKTQLMKEKDLLATSLRQEAVYTRHLEDERTTLESQLEDLKLCIARVTDELQIERERGSLVAKDYNSLMKDFEQLQVELQDQTSSSMNIITGLQEELSALRSTSDQSRIVTMDTERNAVMLQTEVNQLKSQLSWQQETEGILKNEKMQLEAEVVGLQAEVCQLQESLTAVQEQTYQQLQQEVRSLREELNSREQELEQSHGSHVTCADETLLEELKVVRTQNLLFQQEISDLKLSLSILEKQSKEKDLILDEMKQHLDTKRTSLSSNEEVDLGTEGKTLHALQEECSRLTCEVSALKEQQNKIDQSESEGLRHQLKSTAHEKARLEMMCDSLKSENMRLEQSQQALKQAIGLLTEAKVAIERDFANQSHRWTVREEEMVSSLHSKEEEVNKLSILVKGLQNELAQTRHNILFRNDCKTRDSDCTTIADNYAIKLKDRETELKELHGQMSRLAHQLEQKTEENATLVQEKTNLLSDLNTVLISQCNAMQDLSTNQSAKISQVTSQTARLCEDLNLTDTICSVQGQLLRTKEQRISQLRTDVEMLRNQHHALSTCLHEQETNNTCKDSDKRVLRQLVGKLSEEKKSLLSEIGHLKDKLDQALAAIKKLEAEMGFKGRSQKSCSTQTRTSRFEQKQLNFLRTKLGYTLAELRLYKKQKEENDANILQLQNGYSQLQRKYRECLNLVIATQSP